MLELTTDQEYSTFERSQFVLKDVTDNILGQYTALSILGGETVFEAYQLGSTVQSHVATLTQGIRFPIEATVVDIGCGIGTVNNVLKQQRPDLNCLNLNLSLEQLKYCNYGVVADGHTLPLLSKCADVVLLVYVLGYGLLESFLKEAARITKPGGIIRIYDVWNDHPYEFLSRTGYASHHPNRVIEVAKSVGWNMTCEEITELYPSKFFLGLMGSNSFNNLFGHCHSVLYRGIKEVEVCHT